MVFLNLVQRLLQDVDEESLASFLAGLWKARSKWTGNMVYEFRACEM